MEVIEIVNSLACSGMLASNDVIFCSSPFSNAFPLILRVMIEGTTSALTIVISGVNVI